MPKIVKVVVNFFSKNEGRLFEDIKKFRKKVSNPGKNRKGDDLCLVRFFKSTKRLLAAAGTRTHDRWVPLNRLTFQP